MKKLLFGFLLLFMTISSFAIEFDLCECELSSNSNLQKATAYLNGKNFVKDENGRVSIQVTKISESLYESYSEFFPATLAAFDICQEKLTNYVDVNVCPLVRNEDNE